MKRTSKQNYYYAMIKMNKQNFSKQWQLINQILQRNGKQKHSIRKLITDENALLTDEKEICDELNSFFVNIGPNMVSEISTNNSSEGTNIHSCIESLPKSFFSKSCTDKEVYLELMKLNEKIENIPIKFLKMTAECTLLLLSKYSINVFRKVSFHQNLKLLKLHHYAKVATATKYKLSPYFYSLTFLESI